MDTANLRSAQASMTLAREALNATQHAITAAHLAQGHAATHAALETAVQRSRELRHHTAQVAAYLAAAEAVR